ncbi:MAG: chain-length determining protein [Muribaculaceae bacterium]|nr:chain-length determining protein [Muribaculaceae bacterium]
MSEQNYNDKEMEEKEIDLLEIVRMIWKRKKTIGLWCLAGALLGLVVAFSIPREYDTSVKLAPESSDGKGGSSNLGALAAMAGVSLGSSGADAVSPQLYPDIMKSVPFNLSLLDIPVTDKEGKRTFTVAEYLQNDVKSPWWSAITGLPGQILGALSSGDKEKEVEVETPDGATVIRLSNEQADLIRALNGAITPSVDIKTNVVTIKVRMQDPMVSAILADSVASRLKEYVTDYRTNKARKDLEYVEKLNAEAKETYYAAQQKYANYLDTHQGIVLYSAQTMRDRLENETQLAFNLFNQTSQQLQMAKAKVQEQTPVYATIEPATVPIKPSAPRKPMILIGFIFLAFAASVAWILFIQPNIRKIKEENEAEKAIVKTEDSV